MDTDDRQNGRALGAVLLGCAVLATSVWLVWLSPGAAARRALDDARDVWEAHEPTAYSFVYSKCLGMCLECPQLITVRDGVVTDAAAWGQEGCGQPDVHHAPTVEDVFAVAEERRPGLLPEDITTTIRYDRDWGFPVSIHLECPDGYLDCGGGWSVSRFTSLG